MNFAQYFSIKNEGVTYKGYVDEKFKNQLIGAFRLIFDLHPSELIDEENDEHRTFSSEIGMRSLGIGSNDHRCPVMANVSLNAYFHLLYKAGRYLIDLNVINWNAEPNIEDFEAHNRGMFLHKATQKNPFDFSKPKTATGKVILDDTFFNVATGKNEKESHVLGYVNDYPSHFKFGTLQQLAIKVKSIIDDNNSKRTNKLPKQPKKQPTPIPKNSGPVLAK